MNADRRVTRRALLTVAATAGLSVSCGSIARARPPWVALTWDGPWRSLLDNGLPLFEQHRIHATVYAITGRLGGRLPGVTHDRFCTADELARFGSAGWEVSSHTVTHPDLTTVSEARLTDEIRTAKGDLEVLGYDVPGFAYPYFRWNPVVRRQVARSYAYARAGGGSSLPRIRSLGVRYALPARLAPAKATALIAYTRACCYDRGDDLIWVAHHVDDPRVSAGPRAALAGYLGWLAGERDAGRLRVGPAWGLVEAQP